MSDNVATLEPPTTAQTETQGQDQAVQATPEVSQVVADTLWGAQTTPYQNVEVTPAVNETPVASTEQQPAAQVPAANADEILDEDDFIRRVTGGLGMDEFKTKWEQFNKPQEAPTPQEIQWANEDSKRFFDYLKEGKEDDVYNFLNQKKQLEKLEKYDVADATQAGEILRANLQFKYKDTLTTQEIDRLYNKQYSLPSKPAQTLDQDADDYAAEVKAWEDQVRERQMDMIIEAKMTKPELSKLRSQIVLPDIQKPQQFNEPTPEELAAAEKKQQAYYESLENSLKTFNDIKMSYKDKEVELPLSFDVTSEEKVNVKNIVESLYSKWDYLTGRWVNKDGSFNTRQMAEDVYWLEYKNNITQNLINDAGSKRMLHDTKVRNNINLKGVNPELGPIPTSQEAPKNDSQLVADRIWSM